MPEPAGHAGRAQAGLDWYLAVDTSCAHGGLICGPPQQPATAMRRGWQGPSTPSEQLGPALAAALAGAQQAGATLRGAVVSLGPGSFTGLRVGLATLKGLCLARSLPLWGLSSLAVSAAAAAWCGQRGGYRVCRVWVVEDARRDHAFVGLYDVEADGSAREVAADAHLSLADLAAAWRAPAASRPARLVGSLGPAALEACGLAAVQPPAAGDQRAAAALAVAAGGGLLRQPPPPLATLLPRYLARSAPEQLRAQQQDLADG